MKVGTKSLLVGYHQFLLHPLIVAWAWMKLYGFPWDLRLWFAFFLHDIGYIGLPNMDGTEGKAHPFLGGHIMHFLFDNWSLEAMQNGYEEVEWFQFCIYHSRSLVKAYFGQPSKLMYADKLAFMLYPVWLLKALYRMSGECEEYFQNDWALLDRAEGFDKFETWYRFAYDYNVKTLEEAGLSWK